MARITKYLCVLVLFAAEFGNISGIPVPGNVESVKMPAMARKAGGSWRPEVTPQPPQVENNSESKAIPAYVESEEEEEEESDSNYSDDDNYYESEEGAECQRGEHYDSRFRGCVPIRCYGGERWRIDISGMCMPKYIVDYNEERRMYPGRFQPTYSEPQNGRRGGLSVGSKTRHVTFFGKKKGPFTG